MRRTARIGVALAVGTLAAAHGWLLVAASAPIDDAAIVYQYAEQVAGGAPLGTLVTGEPVSEGWSNPTLFAAEVAGAALGVSPETTSRSLGVALLGVAAALLAAMTTRLSADRSSFALAPLLALGFVPAVWAASGLENSIVAVLLVATATAVAAEERHRLCGWRGCGSGLLAATLAVSRPEALVYLGAAFLAKAIAVRRNVSSARSAVVGMAIWSLVAVGPVAAYFWWHNARFGFTFPNTVYAKTADTPIIERALGVVNPLGSTWRETLRFAASEGLLGMAWAFVVGVQVLRKLPERSLLLLGAASLALPLWEKDWMAHFRFYSTTSLVASAIALLGTAMMFKELRATADRRRRQRLAGAAALGLVCFAPLNLVATSRVVGNDNQHAVTADDIAAIYGGVLEATNRYGILDPLLIAPDAGATTHRLGLRLIDGAGLVDTQVAHTLQDRPRLYRYAFEERRADLVFLHSEFLDAWGLDDAELTELGYLSVPFNRSDYEAVGVVLSVRRDHVVAPATEPPLRVQSQADPGGTLIVRSTWGAGHLGAGVEAELRSASGRTIAVDGSAIVGAGSAVADDLAPGERLRSVSRIDVPTTLEPGRYEVVVRAAAEVYRSEVTVGGALDLDDAVDVDPRFAIAELTDLREAAPQHLEVIDEAIAAVRRSALSALASSARGAVAEGDATTFVDVAREAATVRGRQLADSTWRALAEGALAQSDERYRWALGAFFADPASTEAALRLLRERPGA